MSVGVPVSVLSGSYQAAQLLNYMVFIFLMFWGTTERFSAGNILHSHRKWTRIPISLHLVNRCYFLCVFQSLPGEYGANHSECLNDSVLPLCLPHLWIIFHHSETILATLNRLGSVILDLFLHLSSLQVDGLVPARYHGKLLETER